MKNLFYMFIREMNLQPWEISKTNANVQQLSIQFNAWITALGNARNKNISNEANKFMIRKWIVNGVF